MVCRPTLVPNASLAATMAFSSARCACACIELVNANTTTTAATIGRELRILGLRSWAMHGDVARVAGGRQQFSAKRIRRRPTAALERRPLQRIGEKLPHGFPIAASRTQFRAVL